MFPDEKHRFYKVKKETMHAMKISCAKTEQDKLSYFKGIVQSVALVITSLWMVLSPTNAATSQLTGTQINISSFPEAQVGKLYVNKKVVSSSSSNNSNVTVREILVLFQ